MRRKRKRNADNADLADKGGFFCGMSNERLIKLKRNLPGGRQAQVERIVQLRTDFLVEVYAELIDIVYLSKSYL